MAAAGDPGLGGGSGGRRVGEREARRWRLPLARPPPPLPPLVLLLGVTEPRCGSVVLQAVLRVLPGPPRAAWPEALGWWWAEVEVRGEMEA